MHDFTYFKNEVMERLKEEHEFEDYTFEERPVLKSNVQLTGLTVVKGSANVCPTLYYEDYYDLYKKGMPIEKITDKMWSAILASYEHVPSYDWESFKNYYKENWRIRTKLINTEKNQELLSTLPSISFGNLSAIFYLVFDDTYMGQGSINITNGIYKSWKESWKITTKELLKKALENSHNEYSVTPIEEVLLDLLSQKDDEESEELRKALAGIPQLPMYVLSNERKIFGSAVLLDLDVWKDFSEKMGGNFYILPSSIHELLAVPDNGKGTPESLAEMVKDVNETEVCPCDVLSNRIYYYDSKRNVICYADDKSSIVVDKNIIEAA